MRFPFVLLPLLTLADLRGDVVISEFLADNASGIEDESGSREDWIELHNTGNSAVDLDGWWLTDDSTEKRQWRFPAVSIDAHSTLLVWASGKNRTTPGAPLHTNFKLSRNGEFLGLYKPHAATGLPVLLSSFGASYPAQLADVSYGIDGAEQAVYFDEPTPDAPNGNGSAGPLIHDATPADPGIPRPDGTPSSPPLKVTIRVIATGQPVAAVRAIHRTMWGGESTVDLNDAGTAPDDVAGDGIYSGNLPTVATAPGEMFRWRFEAEDSEGAVTGLPAFADPADSPRYFGTVAANTSTASSQLPVLEWFVEDAPADGPDTDTFRGACYYLGRFYDNIRNDIHGQSTASFTKKSYDFDSNDGHRFVWREGERAVRDFNLLTNYADKTKARNTISHELGKAFGTPHHFAFPVRVQLNGVFHGVLDMVEDSDDRMLERNGLDGDGALYKIYAADLVSGAEKKTRKDEGNGDLVAMVDALDPSQPLAARRTYGYDNVNIAATVNYLVTRQFNSEVDHGDKNMYLYRDTEGSGEWRPIVWDVDLSQGHNWTPEHNYFDDGLHSDNDFNAQAGSNGIYNLILDSPEMRQMWVRRMRTLMDEYLQPPGTVDGYLETRMRAIAASIDPDPADPSGWTDGDLDAARWGFHPNFIPNRPREEVERWITGYLQPRRAFLFSTGANRPRLYSANYSTSIFVPENSQSNVPGMVVIEAVDYLPASGNQAEEYLILKNTTSQAVDLSGWTLEGAIEHTLEGGTVIPPGDGSAASDYQGLLHVVKDPAAFRHRASGPTGGQRRWIQGPYSGQFSARGETVTLRDPAGTIIASFSYPGTPSDLQQFLRISEIQYHPADPTPAEEVALPAVTGDDFEYLELANTGPSPLQLAGATFTEGIGFSFPSASLPAGERLVLAKNPAAFALRYPGTTALVFGPYDGVLANAGEFLEITDALGEKILGFEYKDGWYPATDGSGRSLVQRDPAGTPYDQYGDPRNWAICGDPLGAPGAVDGPPAQAYRGWDNFHFTALQRDDPLISGPDADPDGDLRPNAEEYALATDPWTADVPLLAFTWSEEDGETRPALRFRCPARALDVGYQLQATDDLTSWPVVADEAAESTPLDAGTEEVVFRDGSAHGGTTRFLRLHFTPVP
ncbi:lamin tail domain-containing protein [Luteolibacter marinus]|uniref:lamin tail domain-containing protein n=1 Tax=Luteolibacter marinus TaxID=2776705 RepID=UPI001865EC9A|nr:lamin tail domain-containing protein [Luteolibacter marinus]